ncbi:MAG: SDR family NAD(P)-dependent oxidoreductase [Phycisphaerales bacterium]
MTEPTSSGPSSLTFSDGTFLVIGGAAGISRAIATGIVARGGSLVVTSRDADRAAAAASELGADDHAALDASDFAAVSELMKRLIEEGHRLAGVVNGAGSVLLKPAHLTTAEELQATLTTNLVTAFSVVAAAGRHMKDGGSVLLFSTAAAEAGIPNHEAIAAAKGGVAALTRSAAATYAARGLRFNAIAPGLVKTGLTEKIHSNERALEASRSMHPLQRVGEPADLAPMALTLLDPANAWMSGEVICVDGGLGRLRGRAG